MKLFIGTSGYDYDEWRGKFYPDDVPKKKRLPYYASKFGTVEINASFYRKPSQKQLDNWAAQVPGDFHFAFKAWQRITHQKRLRDCADLVTVFNDELRAMGPRLGPVLYGLPPNFKKDVPRLRDFLNQLPRDLKAAFEFRNESWFDDETYKALSDFGVALCIGDLDELRTPFVRTARFGYLRLRRASYSLDELKEWSQKIDGAGFSEDVYCYFKHEDEAKGPDFALELLRIRGSSLIEVTQRGL